MEELSILLGSLVYLDANIIIYAVEGFPSYERQLKFILSAMDSGELTAATSELTLAEVLVKPMDQKNILLQTAYREFLRSSPSLQVAPISQMILIEAANIRATTQLRLPDAIHVATAKELGCKLVLTNDRTLHASCPISSKLLDDLTVA